MQRPGPGYFLNPDTGKLVRVTTHDAWIRDWNNAQSIGLHRAAYDKLMQLPATDIDGIRMVALDHGLVRIRRYGDSYSVQFAAQRHRVKPILWAVYMAFRQLGTHPDTAITIGNLFLRDEATVTLDMMKQRIQDDEPILREQDDEVPNIPIDYPVSPDFMEYAAARDARRKQGDS